MIPRAIIFATILVVLLFWVYSRQRIRYWAALLYERGWKSTVHYDRCLTIFRKLFDHVDSFKVSTAERHGRGMHDRALTYGEVVYYSFVRILEMAKPQPGEIFYDLGSGGGKAVFIASLIFDFSKVCGIEKLDGLYEQSHNLVKKLEAMSERQKLIPYKKLNINFIHSDFLNSDFSDADIVFLNATCWSDDLLNSIIARLQKLKKGTRVILVTADLNNVGGFQLIYDNLHLMSWGLSYVRIYQRI